MLLSSPNLQSAASIHPTPPFSSDLQLEAIIFKSDNLIRTNWLDKSLIFVSRIQIGCIKFQLEERPISCHQQWAFCACCKLNAFHLFVTVAMDRKFKMIEKVLCCICESYQSRPTLGAKINYNCNGWQLVAIPYRLLDFMDLTARFNFRLQLVG